MSIKSEVIILGSDLSLGETLRTLCPRCLGGRDNEKSLSVTLREDGLVWQCFRAKCDESGASSPQLRKPSESILDVKPKPRRQFTGITTPLNEEVLSQIKSLWGIENPPYWYWTPEYGGRIAMSLRSPKYVHRGWVLRSLRKEAKLKALTYVDEGEEGISWYRNHIDGPTIIVEDIPSAVRASKYMNVVALCGTGIGPARAEEIENYATRPVVVALDQDATKESFRIANRWGLLWGDVKVLPLTKDIKNMTEEELCELLNEGETCLI